MTDRLEERIVVLGAGVAGLAAGKVLSDAGRAFRVIEKQDGPGGLVRTDSIGDFLFDRAGHFIHARTDFFGDVLRESGIEFNTYERRSAVLFRAQVVPYPIQFNLWACHPEVREAISVELDDVMAAELRSIDLAPRLEQTWGTTLSAQFFRPYLEKMWGQPLENIPSSWGSRFIPDMDLGLVRKGLEQPLLDYGYNSSFLYPSSGRIGDLTEAMASDFDHAISYNSAVVEIDVHAKTIRLASGETLRYSKLISTLPLNQVLAMVGRIDEMSLLTHSNVLNVRVGFRGKLHCSEHWFYLPDKATPFFRAGFPSNISNHVCPSDSLSISLELGLGESQAPSIDIEPSVHDLLNQLEGVGLLEWERIDVMDCHLIRPAYVMHRMSVTPQLREVAAWLESEDVFVAGRYGAWDYMSLEDAYVSGAELAERMVRYEQEPAQSIEHGA